MGIAIGFKRKQVSADGGGWFGIIKNHWRYLLHTARLRSIQADYDAQIVHHYVIQALKHRTGWPPEDIIKTRPPGF